MRFRHSASRLHQGQKSWKNISTLFGWKLFLPSLLHFQNIEGGVRQKRQRSPIDLFVFGDEDEKEMMKRVQSSNGTVEGQEDDEHDDARVWKRRGAVGVKKRRKERDESQRT